MQANIVTFHPANESPILAVPNGRVLQFRKRGNWYEPLNPDAVTVCRLAGTETLPGSRLQYLGQLGFTVEEERASLRKLKAYTPLRECEPKHIRDQA